MVYCNLKENRKDSAVYNIGTTIGDLSGEVVFYASGREPELTQQAKKEPVRNKHIAKIYGKYYDDFAKGIFKEKIAYEVG